MRFRGSPLNRKHQARTINAQTIKHDFYVVNAAGGAQGEPFKVVITTTTTDLQNQTTVTTNTVTDWDDVCRIREQKFPDDITPTLKNNVLRNYNVDGTSYTTTERIKTAQVYVTMGSNWQGPVDVRVWGTEVVRIPGKSGVSFKQNEWQSGTYGTKYANDSFLITVSPDMDPLGQEKEVLGYHVVGFGVKD